MRTRAMVVDQSMTGLVIALVSGLVALVSPAAYALPGSIDRTFGVDGRVAVPYLNQIGPVAPLNDGRFVATRVSSPLVARYLADGTLDPSFGAGGTVNAPFTTDNTPFLDATNRILLIGRPPMAPSGASALSRLASDGSTDPTFAGGGTVLPAADERFVTAAVQTDGRILVGVMRSAAPFTMVVRRFLDDGTADASFGSAGTASVDPGVDAFVQQVMVQPGGAIVATASSTNAGILTRLDDGGTLDPSFGTNGFVTTADHLQAILRPDGRILALTTHVTSGNPDTTLLQFDADGAPDPTFGTNGVANGLFPGTYYNSALNGALQPDGSAIVLASRVFLAGPMWDAVIGNVVGDIALIRVAPDGTLDPGFGEPLVPYSLYGTPLPQPDGGLLLAGGPQIVRLFAGHCGDGIVQPGEDCDDGNTADGDGCDAHCCVADTDGDGTCDSVDACTGPALMTHPKLVVDRMQAFIYGTEPRLVLSGTMTLASPFTPALDPATNGIRLELANSVRTVFDISIPGGALGGSPEIGWTTRTTAAGHRWQYVDKTPSTRLSKIVVEDRSNRVPGQVKLTVRASDQVYLDLSNDLPASALVVFDRPLATSAQCAEARFPGPMPVCTLFVPSGKLTCR